MQRESLQFSARRNDPAFALLVSLMRSLIRNSVSRDMLILALHDAQKETGASREQMGELKELLLGFWKRNKIYPDGF
jgi:hypothetical protein